LPPPYLGLVEIEAEIRQGTRRDAVLFSVDANAAHGLRPTNEDKRRAVTVLLSDPEWAAWSDREIARRCGVHHDLVARLRPPPSLAENASEPASRTYTTKHGTQAQMRTTNIDRRTEAKPESAPPSSPIRSTVGEAIRSALPALEQRAVGMAL
jgi:hypothetical protein